MVAAGRAIVCLNELVYVKKTHVSVQRSDEIAVLPLPFVTIMTVLSCTKGPGHNPKKSFVRLRYIRHTLRKRTTFGHHQPLNGRCGDGLRYDAVVNRTRSRLINEKKKNEFR